MIEAELPSNEPERLYALNQYQIMDTEDEECFNDLVQLAASICNVPISIISLLDDKRSWFKSAHGVERGAEVDRKFSICSHAILQPDVFIVEDTSLDERFVDNPTLNGDLNVRFYAGAPLKTSDGQILGTLCIQDSKPRKLEPSQIEALRILAHQVMVHLELRKSHRALEVSNEKLKEINFNKDKFFSIIAHDLRAPFHGILGFSEVLETEIEDLDEKGIRDIVGYLRSTAHATFRLLENLLQWAMSEGGAIIYRPQDVQIEQVFQTVFEVLGAMAQKKNVILHNDADPRLTVHVDLNMMTSVLQNLTSNAIKFTPSGGHVYLSAHKVNEEIHIAVRDTGIGMPEEQIREFFMRQQPKSIKGTDGEKGTGLGLLLCRQFVEKNNGRIEINSKPNEGTTFTIMIPYKPPIC
ncbi:GAF domain-containing sensor histidine kinase [Alkanindiges illinoisensis]|uniref:histidine kinase n=1 Tax=Alkanindiges illinoisensis TaxID=197183 RepID=A0A4Y7X9T7_9GAMM|nr:GAF domain-containing sensor histidine kinase [Alkanindiges illinoisensis]TEU23833.1 GAF domain-containing sensor histidine kinase [Alkanindiges illinoisensis]